MLFTELICVLWCNTVFFLITELLLPLGLASERNSVHQGSLGLVRIWVMSRWFAGLAGVLFRALKDSA